MDQDQESDGTNLVIFVVGGVALLLLLLGGGAFFFLMRAEGMGAAPFEERPVMEAVKMEVHEAEPVPVGDVPAHQAVQKGVPVNEPPVPEGPQDPPPPPKR